MKNGMKPILSQLDAIAEHITGPTGYSMDSLRTVRAALLDTFDHIEAEIIKRENARPVGGLLDGILKPGGGAA
ncbi:hypothetical protein [Bradyrhizobium sp. CW1]|uniref:hypothetical protein n=1 Tax=Bradyrhizobium sp. CW1 TaxID=2782686 RepID=UPI001FFECBDB|nr:hypothetical protein [Bradyrhizobium sp. CW1]UPJ31005.1 hypothetical protein IVB54_19360 [Bradyrhizobium sp. CW1]